MTRVFLAASLLIALVGTSVGHAEDDPPPIDPARSAEFSTRMFGAPIGKKAAYACFSRRYDQAHLAQHPLQKVTAMKLLVTAQDPAEEHSSALSFRLGFKFRHRKGDFASSGYCRHTVAEANADELRLGCGVDCDGGGIEVALSNDDKSATVRVQRVRIWRASNQNIERDDELNAGADDDTFRLERISSSECAPLVTDRKVLAALRHK
jgi:hypothetical protein